MKKITLEFKGYWLEKNKDDIDDKSGIYCVYTCEYNAEKHIVSIGELLYIGEATDIQDRIRTHDRLDDWMNALKAGETLCYSRALIGEDRERAEVALIYHHKPPMNNQGVNDFHYPPTEMELKGKIAKLCERFRVEG